MRAWEGFPGFNIVGLQRKNPFFSPILFWSAQLSKVRSNDCIWPYALRIWQMLNTFIVSQAKLPTSRVLDMEPKISGLESRLSSIEVEVRVKKFIHSGCFFLLKFQSLAGSFFILSYLCFLDPCSCRRLVMLQVNWTSKAARSDEFCSTSRCWSRHAWPERTQTSLCSLRKICCCRGVSSVVAVLLAVTAPGLKPTIRRRPADVVLFQSLSTQQLPRWMTRVFRSHLLPHVFLARIAVVDILVTNFSEKLDMLPFFNAL